MSQNTKSSKILVTRKLPKTKFHQVIKSKTKVKDTSGNANRKKAGARFYCQTPPKKIQGLKHTGEGRLHECLCFEDQQAYFLLISSLSPFNLSTLSSSSGSKCLEGVSSYIPGWVESARFYGSFCFLAYAFCGGLRVSFCLRWYLS